MIKDKGYFCTIKYFNDKTRSENINIGVMVYSQKKGKLTYDICREKSLTKLKFFYPNIDLGILNILFDEFELLVKEINSNDISFEDAESKLNHFFNYSLRIESFRKLLIDDADNLKELYEDFVCSKDELEIWESGHSYLKA